MSKPAVVWIVFAPARGNMPEATWGHTTKGGTERTLRALNANDSWLVREGREAAFGGAYVPAGEGMAALIEENSTLRADVAALRAMVERLASARDQAIAALESSKKARA